MKFETSNLNKIERMFLTFFRICKQNKRITVIFLICFIFLFRLNPIFAEGDPELRNKVRTVVIDPGHGGKDPGALGKKHKEKDVVLAVALKLGEYIKNHFDDVNIIYTRSDDRFIPLDERPVIANKNKADLFISIHANASPKSYSYGAETFVMGDAKNAGNFEVAKLENSVISFEENYEAKYEGFDPSSIESYIIFSLLQHTYLEQSLNFADKIQCQFRDRVNRFDRGVKQAGFLVLWKTTMPSVLVELGFMSNPEEEKFLATGQGQDYLASALFRAFREYKKEIESGSNFQTANPEQVQAVQTEPVIFDNKVYYKIQVFSSQNKISLQDRIFEGCDFPEEFPSENLNRYGIGRYSSYEEASTQCQSWQTRFNGAFVIAVKERNIIPLSQAIKELNNKN